MRFFSSVSFADITLGVSHNAAVMSLRSGTTQRRGSAPVQKKSPTRWVGAWSFSGLSDAKWGLPFVVRLDLSISRQPGPLDNRPLS
jgi:hypothetical protein